MDLETIRCCLDNERRRLARDGETIEVLPHLTRIGSAEGSWHSVAFSSLPTDKADRIIAEEMAHWHTLAAEVEWKVYGHDKPTDLRHRLARRGFEVGALEAVLVLDLHDAPAWIESHSNFRVVRVASLQQVEQFRQLSEEIFAGDGQSVADDLRRGILAESTEHLGYIAMDETTPASVGRLYTHRDSAFGGLYGGGTLSSHRGRGLYRALVAARAQDAIKFAARYLIVDALPTSRPILERLGFVHLTDTWPCTLRP